MNKIDISEWKEFEISRIFSIETPASRSIKTYNEGDVPYVSSGSVNNGIISYLEPKDDEELEKGNCITVSPLDGSSFYQEDDFLGRGGAGSAISMLYNENLTKYNSLFICTVIKISAQKFDYSDAFTSDNLKKLKICLPAQKDNKGRFVIDPEKKYSDEGFIPAWSYMEDYMIEIEKKAQDRIDVLSKI
jgi:restriction endonuclease S subunit